MESLLANSEDSTMFDYLGNVMIHAPHCPPLDTEDKMNRVPIFSFFKFSFLLVFWVVFFLFFFF